MTTFEFIACCIGITVLSAGVAWVVWEVASYCVTAIRLRTYLTANSLYMKSWNRVVPAMEATVKRAWIPSHEQEIILRYLSAVNGLTPRGDAEMITHEIVIAIQNEFQRKETQ